jgi:peptidylprolyl isomerase
MRKLLICLAVLLAACGSNGAETPTESTEPAQDAVQACEDRTPEAPAKQDEVGDKKPEVTIPDGAPPCKLVIQDIHEGDGDKAKEGGTVTVQYVGVSWSTGEQFDASWDGGSPATFPLANVIQGWQQGIPGMREGGRRQLIIPPDLAYGDSPPQGIAPGETLVFVIDMIKAA